MKLIKIKDRVINLHNLSHAQHCIQENNACVFLYFTGTSHPTLFRGQIAEAIWTALEEHAIEFNLIESVQLVA